MRLGVERKLGEDRVGGFGIFFFVSIRFVFGVFLGEYIVLGGFLGSDFY